MQEEDATSTPLEGTPDLRASRRAVAARLPRPLTAAIVVACIVPGLLMLLGVDFGLGAQSLSGRFVHTLLEWTAFTAGVGVTVMAFCHFAVSRDATTPVLGIALLCAALVDAFHVLAADELIPAATDSERLVPFTWVLSRLFHVLLLMIGAGLFLARRPAAALSSKAAPRAVLATGVAFGLLAFVAIHLSVTSPSLPSTMGPGTTVPRPWDLLPLALLLVAGLVVWPRFHRAHPSVFSHALVVSALPGIAAQLHMAFGSTALFDGHFNVAHGLKALAYGTPLVGLLLDYTQTLRRLDEREQEVDRVQAALRRSEAPLRTLYESNIIAIMFADIHGNVNDANDAFLDMIGYERHELPLRWLDLTPPEWLPADEEAIRQCHERGVVPVWEKEYIHKDGSRVPILVAVAMLDMEAGTCICPILDLSERSRLEKAVLEQSEKERRRLAQNLHDGLGQHLTGLSFLAKALEVNLTKQGVAHAEGAERIRKLAEEAVTMARSMAQVVCPADLESDGLGPALSRMAGHIETVFGVSCRFEHDAAIAVRDDTTATHLYHIAQEAITNAIKHGKAGSIDLALATEDDELVLTITDDGVGMPEAQADHAGMGLGIMRHRARMIGATLVHGPGETGGTRVSCRMPQLVNIG